MCGKINQACLIVQIFKTLKYVYIHLVFDEYGTWTSSIALTDECI